MNHRIGATLVLIALAITACNDEGATPPPPTLEGDWIVTNEATGVETLLELDQRDDNLSGYWHLGQQAVRVTGRITPSNEFDLTGRSNNLTHVFNAEANDGLSRFSGTISAYDVRGDRASLQMISGRR